MVSLVYCQGVREAAAFSSWTVTISKVVFFGTSGCKMSDMASFSSLMVTIPKVVFLGMDGCKMSNTNSSWSNEGHFYLGAASWLL